MRRGSCKLLILVFALAVSLVVAGGACTHSVGSTVEAHVNQSVTSVDILHGEMSNDQGGTFSGNETVHCGAYLLALTSDVPLSGPDLLQVIGTVPPSLALSRQANLDPPPPRPVPLPA